MKSRQESPKSRFSPNYHKSKSKKLFKVANKKLKSNGNNNVKRSLSQSKSFSFGTLMDNLVQHKTLKYRMSNKLKKFLDHSNPLMDQGSNISENLNKKVQFIDSQAEENFSRNSKCEKVYEKLNGRACESENYDDLFNELELSAIEKTIQFDESIRVETMKNVDNDNTQKYFEVEK
ncbi:hypothetical protein HELRODRAFT_180320 [Helobdella robusta]|uniref:Uncharacterized protein n=1 Tax=Helobdella robusta TaxID=6412 RepID=T1FFQ8_HELRO|nr:hypothetical protein HELRODRAFT_180320 [Helobdella robusta]ESN93913.1 hypothetical protein HELRODRAFT_180320 [Helobdella robusta]